MENNKLLKNKIRVVCLILLISVTFLSVILGLIIQTFASNAPTLEKFVMRINVSAVLLAVAALGFVVLLFKQFTVFSKFLLLAPGVILIGQTHFYSPKVFIALLSAVFVLSILNFIVEYGKVIIKSVWQKKAYEVNKVKLNLNAFSALVFSAFVCLVKETELKKFVATENLLMKPFAIIALVITVLALILYIALYKTEEKKKYFFNMFGCCFLTFFVVFSVSASTTDSLNYAFSENNAVCSEYQIERKAVEYAGRGATRYYFYFKDGEKEISFLVSKFVYNSYSQGSKISLYKSVGALGFEYYEYRLDGVFKYATD